MSGGSTESSRTRTRTSTSTRFDYPFFAPCKVIRNPGNFGLWNPESTALESGIQLMGSGIQP